MNQWILLILALGLSHSLAYGVECNYLAEADPIHRTMSDFLNARTERLMNVSLPFNWVNFGEFGSNIIFVAGKKAIEGSPASLGIYYGLAVCDSKIGQFIPATGAFKTKDQTTYDELLPLGSCQGQEEETKRQVILQVQEQLNGLQKKIKAKTEDFGYLWPVSLGFLDRVGVAFAGASLSDDGNDGLYFFGMAICEQGTLILQGLGSQDAK